ncbi:MAG: RsiV family protein [Candidatus Paceibacteria bacterium]
MKKGTALGIIVILIALAGILFFAATKPFPAKAPGTAAIAALSGNTYIEHAPYYDIAANYASTTPLLDGAGTAANAAAVATMKKFIGDAITQFKTDGNFANLTAADVQTMGFDKGRKETLQITYLIASSLNTVSYIFTTYEDTLGAHGNTFFHTFTFSTNTGAALALSDLFLPGAPYLDTLSTISRAKLPGVIGDQADTAFIKGGTTADEKNFQNFFIDNKELVILFDPYAVAPYSAGPQTLRIPLTAIANILKPEYR